MKLLSINNSCYSSVDNKYNKRAKPAIHTISQQRLTNNNSKPIETQCLVSSAHNSSLSTQNFSRIPTNAFSTLSPKNQSASSFSSLPSLSPTTHKPSSISLRYHGYNHDSKIVFSNNVINPLNKKQIQLSPHQIKYNLITKQMPEDVYGKKIVDVIYKVVNNKNENDKGNCRLNCEIKMKYMTLYEKVMSSVMKHCVEFRNRNNVEIGRAVIEGLYDEEIKKMKCNIGEYGGNVYGNSSSIHNTINTNNYYFYETDGGSNVNSIHESGNANEGGNIQGDDISLINEKSAELETSYDNKGKAGLSNGTSSMQVGNKVNQNGKCKLNEIQRIKERMRLFTKGRSGYNGVNGFVFGMNTARNSMNMKYKNYNINREHEKQMMLNSILFKKEKHASLNRNNNNSNNSRSNSNNVHSNYNSSIMSSVTNDEDNQIKSVNKTKSVIFNNSNSNSNELSENKTKELSIREKHSNSTQQPFENITNNASLPIVTQEERSVNMNNKDEELVKYEQSNNNVQKSLDNKNDNKAITKLNRKNCNTKLKEYNKWVVHNRNDNEFLSECCNENALLAMSNQHEQSTKEETNAAFFNVKKKEHQRMKGNDIIIKNKHVNNITRNNSHNNNVKDINHSKSKIKSKHNIKKKEVSLQINNQFVKNDNSFNKTLQKVTTSNKQESTDENIRKSFYRDPIMKSQNTNTNVKSTKPKRSKVSSTRIKPIQLLHYKTSYCSFINKNLLLKQITYKSSSHNYIQLSDVNVSQGERAFSAKHPSKFNRKFKKLKLGLLHSSLYPKDYLNYSMSHDSLSVSSVSSLMSISFDNDNHKPKLKYSQNDNNDSVMQLRNITHKKAKHGKDFFNMKSVSKFINYRTRRFPSYKTNRQRSMICQKEEIAQEEVKEQKTQLQRFMDMINKAKGQGTEVYIKELTEFLDGEFESSDLYKAKILEGRMNKFKADLRSNLDIKKEMSDNIMKGIQFQDVCLFQNKSVIT